MIQFISENILMPKIEKQKIKLWIKEVISLYDKKIGEIAFIFVNDEKILELNKQYLKHDYYTDIITFDYSEVNLISGDIFISLDTVKSNSDELNIDYIHELHRILIHGILHLCGQGDKTPELRAIMTEKENMALNLLQKHNIVV
jgi:rRNA maturation RNase YbeY